MNGGAESGRESPGDGSDSPTRDVARPSPTAIVPATTSILPRKAAKPAKPRKLEQRRRGRRS